MDVPPQQPAPVPPVVRAQPVTHLPPPPSGCGSCFGAGCLTFFVIGVFALVLLLGGSWFLCRWAINNFTSSHPVEVAVVAPSEAEFAAAKDKLEQLKTALHAKQAVTLSFTAMDLNALVARHPDFVARKGKMRFAIADSVATVEMSVPLDTTDLPWVKRRWFNGSANFGFIYADEGFRFDANWLEANGHRISGSVLRYAEDGFDRGFSRGFKEASGDAWDNVKTMTLDEDKLVIITRGP